MAYLGRKGASAPLTSADIPAGSVSAVKVASDVATQAELDAQRTNSSITTLGTVTAGNLSNSAIVYPAGHVIGTIFNSSASQTTTTTGTAALAVSASIVTSNSTNKVLAIATVQCTSVRASGVQVLFGFSMTCTSATTAIFGPLDGNGYYSIHDQLPTTADRTFGGYYTVQKLFEPDSEGTITVQVYGHSYSGTGNTLTMNKTGTTGYQGGISSITLMEIVST
jgi:hypothetical protein